MKLYISKSKLEYLSEAEIAVYTALKIKYDELRTNEKERKNKDVIIVTSILSIKYALSGSFDITRTMKDKLINGLNGLIDKNIIQLIDSNIKNNKINESTHFVLNIRNLWIDSEKEHFLITNLEEVRKIFKCKENASLNFFMFALNLLGTINNNDKVGYSSVNTLQKLSAIKSNKTAVNFMKLLEDNNIIYIKHSDSAKRDSNGQIKNLSNCYGRLADKYKIDNFYYERCKKLGYDFTLERINSNKKAEISRNYNSYVENKYNGDIVELCANVIAYNQDYYTIQNEQQKDLSIFDAEIIEKAKEFSVKETVNNLNEQEEKAVAYAEKNNPYEEDSQEKTSVEEEIPIQEDKVVVITKRFSGRTIDKEVDKKLIHKNNTPLESEIKFMNDCYQKILDEKPLNETWEAPMLKEFERKYNWSIDKYKPKNVLEESLF